MTFGDRAADWVAANLGRWAFVIGQTVIIIAWMWSDALGRDPFPWMFLNLALSLQAAYTGPVLLISSNRADATRQQMLALIEAHTDQWEQHAEETHALIRELHAMDRRVMAHLGLIEAAVDGEMA